MALPIRSFLDQCIPPEHLWKVELFAHWPSIIGPLEERVSIQKIDAETLYLAVYHPAWAQEIALLAPRIKRNINKLFSEPKIKHIRFCAPAPLPQQRRHIAISNHRQFQQNLAPQTVPLTLNNALAQYLNRCKSMVTKKEKE